MSSEPFAPSEVSVTIKGDGKDATWLVARGTPANVKANLIESFGIDGDKVKDWTLFDVASEATKLAKGQMTTALKLGGTPVTGDEPLDQAGAQAQSKGTDDDPTVELLKAVEGIGSVDDLKRLWAENKDTFAASSDLTAAYKAKGKALTAK